MKLTKPAAEKLTEVINEKGNLENTLLRVDFEGFG